MEASATSTLGIPLSSPVFTRLSSTSSFIPDVSSNPTSNLIDSHIPPIPTPSSIITNITTSLPNSSPLAVPLPSNNGIVTASSLIITIPSMNPIPASVVGVIPISVDSPHAPPGHPTPNPQPTPNTRDTIVIGSSAVQRGSQAPLVTTSQNLESVAALSPTAPSRVPPIPTIGPSSTVEASSSSVGTIPFTSSFPTSNSNSARSPHSYGRMLTKPQILVIAFIGLLLPW